MQPTYKSGNRPEVFFRVKKFVSGVGFTLLS
jgi:hypothetical protein